LLKGEAAHSFNSSKLDDWWNPRPAPADLPSDQWLGSAIGDAMQHTEKALAHPSASAWYNVHEQVLKIAAEAK
jgi:hypothetical protein